MKTEIFHRDLSNEEIAATFRRLTEGAFLLTAVHSLVPQSLGWLRSN